MTMKGWDLRALSSPIFADKRTHQAGVCVIQSNPHCEHILASGSYDEHVRIWDIRTLRKPLEEISLGGGVWRLQWHPEWNNVLLCACMHNGFKVVPVHSIVSENDACSEKHFECASPTALGYGVDWCRDARTSERRRTLSNRFAAVCSFYDHQFRMLKI